MVLYFDAHTHSHLRGPEELEAMAAAGVRGIVVCAFLPVRPSGPATLRDLFTWLSREERARLRRLGLEPRIALGIHPRCIPEVGFGEALDLLGRCFDEGSADALGEVGLETCSMREREVLAAQLRLARSAGLPVVMHTPRSGKSEAFDEAVAILEAEAIDPAKVILDHLTPALAQRARNLGALAGLTLQPGKTTAAEVCSLIARLGAEGLVANSDLSHAPSDPLAVPRLAAALADAGVAADDIEKVTCSNAAALLRL